jgi:ATP-binding cassette subfamily B protein
MKELRRLMPYLRKYRNKIYLGFLFVTISNICSTYVPRLVGQIVDMIQKGNFAMSDIFLLLAYMLLLTLGSGLFMFLTRQTIIVVSRLIEYDLREDYLSKIQSQAMNFYNTNSSGSLIAYATNDIPAAREFLGPAIMYAANTVTTFAFALYYMLSLNVNITLFSLMPLPLIAITTYFIGRKVHTSFRDVQDEFSKLTTQAQETFSGIRIVFSYVREMYELGRFDKLSREYMKKNLRLARYQALMMPLLMILVGLSQIIVLGYGGFLVIEKQASIGDLAQFFIYVSLLIWPVAAIGWITNLVQRASASMGRLGKIFDLEPEITDNESVDISITKIDGQISFNDVTFTFNPATPPVLNNLNLDIPRGTSLGIVGTIGSGKSTIATLLPRLYDIQSGKILIDDNDIQKIPLSVLRKSIGMSTQDTFLFSDTIANNIRFGNPGATEAEIEQAARIANVHDDIMTFTDGYNTMLGERGITLSGGQKQRVSLARTIIKNPSILILDDSLSAVDTQTENRILSDIKLFLKSRTTIIISHRISAVRNLDNIIMLDDGRIIEQGTHDYLASLKGKYSEMYERQKIEDELQEIE